MTVKTARITILGTPDFKDFLQQEAKKEKISLSELVRQRCQKKPDSQKDEELLKVLLREVTAATSMAKLSLEKGMDDAAQVLAEIKAERVA